MVMRASHVAALAVVLLTAGCGPTAQKAASPSPSPASSPSPPADSGVVIFKLTLKGSIASDDGFDLKFDVPNVGQDLFQLCDQFTKPCVAGQTYTLQFTKLGSGSAPYSFRHQVHAQAANMQIQPFSSGTVNLAAGGSFEATYPPG